jgi:hypothetical protein
MRGGYDGRNPACFAIVPRFRARVFLSLCLSILNLKRCRTDFKKAV